MAQAQAEAEDIADTEVNPDTEIVARDAEVVKAAAEDTVEVATLVLALVLVLEGALVDSELEMTTPFPILFRMFSHLLSGKLTWFSVWSRLAPYTLAVTATSESDPFLSDESYSVINDASVSVHHEPIEQQVVLALTSQNMDPARPWSCTYLALIAAMAGVSKETNSWCAASYE